MRYHFRKPAWWRYFVVVALFLAIGCAQRKATSPEEVGAPASTPGTSLSPPPSIFPHADDWANPASHGAWVVQFDSKTCLDCHKIDSTTDESTPTCNSCHPLFPHDSDWVKKENHGAEVLSNGRSACATQCHGSDLKGGLSGISCDLCHTIYPHPTGWSSPSQHGVAAKGTGKSLCQGCHGSDLLGGKTGISCNQCHGLYPHAADWAEPDQHGATTADQGSSSCATLCHGADLKGGLSGVGCDSCHNLYPHSDQWGVDHRATALTLGTTACQPCHGTNLRTILDGKNCYSCHADFPHSSPSSWLPFTGGHGQRVKSVYSGNTTSCQACHGTNLKTVKADGKNCFTCHPTYPHDNASVADWGTYEGHGQYASPPAKRPECQLCHGTDYNGGVRSNPSCFSCHTSYPHIQLGWLRSPGQVQEHGNYVVAHTSSSCATARCHGTGLVPTPGVTQGPGCSSCHSAYPHAPGWNSGTVHGPVARANIDLCKGCHGAGLNVAPPGYQSCVQCHPSYLQHETAELGVTNWDTYAGHGTFLQGKGWNATECQACHGADLLGGVSLISCKSCHASFPHTDAGWETATGHPNYIASTLGGNLTTCKVCHGNNLTGGHSGVSCGTCHPNYPHSVTPNWSTTGHGPHALTPSDRDTCKTCHGADLLGGTSGISCTSCHTEFPHSAEWLAKQTETVTTTGECCNPDDEYDCWSCTYSTNVDRMFLHGQKFMEQKAAGFPVSPNRCNTCHGTDYAGGQSLVACTSCHAGYPHIKYGTNWRVDNPLANPLGGQHTVTFLSGPHNATSQCTDCHVNFGAGVKAIGLTGVEAPTCTSCHDSYPHLRINLSPDSWIYRAGVPPGYPHGWQYNHGWNSIMKSYGESHGGSPSMCKTCHGAVGGHSTNCNTCHLTGAVSHVAPAWRPASGHGVNFIRAKLAGFPSDTPDQCHDCHPVASTRSPKVCNPFTASLPGSASNWCSECHIGPCPCVGMNPTTGVCP